MRLAYWSALLPSVASVVMHDTSALLDRAAGPLQDRYSCSKPLQLVKDIKEASSPGNPDFVLLAEATAVFMKQLIGCIEDRKSECRDADRGISSIGLTTDDIDAGEYLVPFHGFWLGFIMRVWTEHVIEANDPRAYGDIRMHYGAPEGFRVSTMPNLPYVRDDREQDDAFDNKRKASIPLVAKILPMWVAALSETCDLAGPARCKFFSVFNTLSTWEHQVNFKFAASKQGECFVNLNLKAVPPYTGMYQ